MRYNQKLKQAATQLNDFDYKDIKKGLTMARDRQIRNIEEEYQKDLSALKHMYENKS